MVNTQVVGSVTSLRPGGGPSAGFPGLAASASGPQGRMPAPARGGGHLGGLRAAGGRAAVPPRVGAAFVAPW